MGNMNNIEVVILIPFNIDMTEYRQENDGLYKKWKEIFVEAQERAWIESRMKLFMHYTVASLKNQIDQEFMCYVYYTSKTKSIIEEVRSHYEVLPPNIQFVSTLDLRLNGLLRSGKILYQVALDSDNMYGPCFISDLKRRKIRSSTRSLICQRGYIYHETTSTLAEIIHPAPSFYAAIYSEETYPLLYKKRLFEKHFEAIKYPYEILEGTYYCICIHDWNLDNEWVRLFIRYGGQLIQGSEKEQILKEWALGG